MALLYEAVVEDAKRRGKRLAAAALVVGLLLGTVVALALTPPPSGEAAPSRTFTVVAYHWGFAIYDEEGQEVPKIEVERGTQVTLLVLGAEALSHEIHEGLMDRTVAAWADRPEYGGKTAMEIMDAMEAAEAAGHEAHSVAIPAYDIALTADPDTPANAQATFTADEVGTFDLQCAVFCGWGHQYMGLGGGFVVT